MQALLSLDHFPAGMELFPASDEDQWALIKGVIDDSDYYLLVIGGRYGSLNAEGISYTEMEFDYALAKKKPIIAFVHEKPAEIPSGKTDENDALRERLLSFKKKATTGRTVKFWTSASDLQAKVIQSVSAETKRNPQEGWVRASRATDPAVVEGLRQEIDRLTAEVKAASQVAPADSSKYAGGSDQHNVQFVFSDKDGTRRHEVATITWNTIFAEIAPTIMDEGSENQMKRHFSNELYRYDFEKFEGGSRFLITDDAFETIKVQLFALGLIKKSDRKHVPSDVNRYWSLTAFGQSTMMRLRAIPKSVKDGGVFA